MIKLKEYQVKPKEFIKNNFGIILYHGTGTGKTITSLASMYQFNNDIIIIGPKSSKKAFEDEIKKLEYDRNRFIIYTFSKFKRLMYDDIDILKNKCVIVDEAHNIRNETRNNMFMANYLVTAYRVMLLTATPVINYLDDLSVLVNIVKKSDVLPTDRKLFNFLYFDENEYVLLNEHILMDKIRNAISFYEIKDDVNYPKSKTIIKKVIMNTKQLEEYKKYLKMIFVNDDILFDIWTSEKKKKNAFLMATRQLSNTIDGDINSPKIISLIKELVSNPFPSIVYSNFLKNGIYPIVKVLTTKHSNITYKIITGNTSPDKIISIVDDYNNGKINILLLSSAGSESLDLKNTRRIHIMEPHWNNPKINQVIGRSIRYKSHSNLPKKDRNVTIYRWTSIFDKKIYNNTSADEYLVELSDKKENIFNMFKKIIVKSSIENNYNDKYNNKYNNQSGGFSYQEQYIKYMSKYKNIK